MEEISSDSYFENIQLVKLVSSAEALFQHIYNLVSFEQKKYIDQWLCFKHELDACSKSKFDLNLEVNGNLVDDDIIDGDEKASYSSDEYSVTSEDECGTEKEDDSDEVSNQNLNSSGFESGSQNMLDEYARNFKMYTESMVNNWFSNLNLESNENSCGDHISNPCRYGIPELPNRYQNYFTNPSNDVLLENKITGLRLCHCCANQTSNCYSILLIPAEEQISFLRELKTPLIQSCQKITSHLRRCDLESRIDVNLVMFQEILEMLDTSIEMKNYESTVESEIEKFKENNNLVYSSMLECFKLLSSTEMHYLFICFFNKVITLRENCSNLDRLILQLDNTIVDKEIRLRYLNKTYIKLRDTCASLQNKSKAPHKELVTDRLEGIINANKQCLQENNLEVQGCSSTLSSSAIPNRCIKVLQRNSSSKSFGVIRQGNKLIIQQNKNS